MSRENVEIVRSGIDAWNRGDIWHGAGYGPGVDLEVTGVFPVRRGAIFGTEFFWDHAEAIEAVGLAE